MQRYRTGGLEFSRLQMSISQLHTVRSADSLSDLFKLDRNGNGIDGQAIALPAKTLHQIFFVADQLSSNECFRQANIITRSSGAGPDTALMKLFSTHGCMAAATFIAFTHVTLASASRPHAQRLQPREDKLPRIFDKCINPMDFMITFDE